MNILLDKLRRGFKDVGYICDDEVTLTVFFAIKLGKPLLIEGEPGVGKTEMGKVLSQTFSTELVRMQCYEGLDENKALYEWNYQRQLLKIQISKDKEVLEDLEEDLFSQGYLLERPLLKALQSEKRIVLLIDEVDKTDQEFEAFLFEILSDFQISIPELGTIRAKHIPLVVLTSNNERELSDGLKRRCVYLYLDFPTIEREIEIIRAKVPEAGGKLTKEIARAVYLLRQDSNIRKKPSIAETLDWTRALLSLNSDRLDSELINRTLSLILKTKTDQNSFYEHIGGAKVEEFIKKENVDYVCSK